MSDSSPSLYIHTLFILQWLTIQGRGDTQHTMSGVVVRDDEGDLFGGAGVSNIKSRLTTWTMA